MHIRGYELARTVFYHPRHVWARIEEEGHVRIGLDDFGQKLMGRVYSVTLPEPGTQVTRGGASWWAAHRTGVAGLAAPVSGIVTQRNERLPPHPSLINHDPYGQGWALVIEPEDHLATSLKHLHYGKQVELWYEQEVEKLQGELQRLFADSRPDVGVTLQDGGWQVEGMIRVLPATELRQIIDLFLAASPDTESGPAG
jgi:glycine cleavage system H protein